MNGGGRFHGRLCAPVPVSPLDHQFEDFEGDFALSSLQ